MIGGASSSLHLLLVTSSLFFCLLTTGPAFRVQQAQTLAAPTGKRPRVTTRAPLPLFGGPGNSAATDQLLAVVQDTSGKLVSAMSNASFATVVQSICKEFDNRTDVSRLAHNDISRFLLRNAGRLAAAMAESLPVQCLVTLIARVEDQPSTLSNLLSDAKFVEVLKAMHDLVDGDQLDWEGEFKALQFLGKVRDRLAALVKASAAPQCLLNMLAVLMTRGKSYDGRRAAKSILERLRDSGASEVRDFLAKWDKAQQQAAWRFKDAVNGKLVKDPEALALASRFYDSPYVVSATQDPPPSDWKTTGWVGISGFIFSGYGGKKPREGSVAIVRRDMTDLECAQACVYITELSDDDSKRLLVTKSSELKVCGAYVLLGGKTCLLSGEQFESNQLSQLGAGRIRNSPFPAAVNFCVAARKDPNLTVASCQATLTAQYASAGAAQVGALGSQQVLRHVCAAQCQSLVQAMKVNLGGLSYSFWENWCFVDVVQLVEAHNLQCCGSSCGWDAGNKTCAGIGLLGKVAQEEWFAECCSPSAVMLGSDRDFMCRSASQGIWNKTVSPQKELQSGPLQAFQRGEDIAPNFNGSRPAASSLVELADPGAQEPRAGDLFQVTPCALICAEPTFMKSALLQCSASNSKEWVTVRDGVQTCPQAGFMQSQKKKSPAECREFGISISGATHASWQFLPGDKSDTEPHRGLCSLYRNCTVQDRNMWAKAKAQMSNDTDVLWSRLKT